MRIFGRELTLFKSAPTKPLSAVPAQSSWWLTVRESFTGAWQRNITVQRDNVLAYWAVYACIRLIAGDIAKMRAKLVVKGDNGIWTEVENGSPFLPVLRKPNPFQTRVQFFMYWYTCLLIHGNTYALKQRDNRGVVVGLFLLDPTGVTVLVGEDGSVFYQLRRDNLNGRGEMLDVTVPASEIIHDRLACLHHPLVGVSPLFACGVAATQGLAIQNNSANFFTNGSMPGGIITVPGSLDPIKAAALKAAWDTNYGGENRGKTAVLADKMEYKPMSITAVESQLIEQLKMTAEMVCSTFGVPAYKVGVGQPPSNANVAAMDQSYYSQSLQVLIEGTEAVLDEGLGLLDANDYTPGTIGIEFDLDALIRMDPTAQMAFVKDGVGAAVMMPNEARKRFDLPPVKGGDTPYLQQQNYSLAALDERDRNKPFDKPAPAPAALPAPTPDPAAADQLAPVKAAIEAIQKAVETQADKSNAEMQTLRESITSIAQPAAATKPGDSGEFITEALERAISNIGLKERLEALEQQEPPNVADIVRETISALPAAPKPEIDPETVMQRMADLESNLKQMIPEPVDVGQIIKDTIAAVTPVVEPEPDDEIDLAEFVAALEAEFANG